MKKIVMINCLKANGVCTGAACMNAFNRRLKTFARYGEEPLELAAFFRCNGCGRPPETDPGMAEKIERLLSLAPDTAHLGVCTKNREGVRCPTIQYVADRLAQAGVEIIDGTH